MNFARAWLSRLISLVKTGRVSPTPSQEDRLQAAREGTSPEIPSDPCADLEAVLKPNPDYRRRRLAHLPPERVRRYWENVEALRG